MKILFRTSDLIEAEIIEAMLKEHEVLCFIQQDTAGGMRPSLAFSSGVTLLVSESDFTKAEELLKNSLKIS